MKGGGRPDQGRDRFVGQEVHEQGREEEVFLGDDVGAGPALEGDINIFHREIKVKRGLVCQNVSLRKAAGVGHPFDEVNDAPVGEDNTLGRAGGAGGEDGVDRVDVQDPVPAALQACFVHRMGKGGLVQQQNRAEVGQGLGHTLPRLSVDQGGGGQRLHDAPQAGQGHLAVQRDVVVPGAQDALKGGQVRRAVIYQHHHRAVGPVGLRRQSRAKPLGRCQQLGKGEGPAFVRKRQLVWEAAGGVLQVFQHIFLQHGSDLPMQFGAFFAPLNNKDSKNEKEQPIFSKFAKIFWERLLSPWFPLFLCCISSNKKGGKRPMTQPIRYLQTDPRWAKLDYSAKGEKTTIGASGCGPTAMAMVLATWADKSVTPKSECAWALSRGYKAPKQGTYYGYFTPAAKRYGLKAYMLNSTTIYGKQDSPYHAKAKAALDQGHLVIACMGPGLWTSSGHFVLLWKLQGNTVFLNDPASTRLARTQGNYALFRKQVKYYFVVERPTKK